MRVKNDTRDVTVAGASLPPIVQELIRHGGLVPYLAARGSLETSGFAVERSLTVGRLLAKPEVFVVQRYSQSG
jgi:hypothetical protein